MASKLAIEYLVLQAAAGALAALDVINVGTQIDIGREQGKRITKMQISGGWHGATPGEGPVAWGFSTGLTAAEVEETLESDPQSSFDVPAQEETMRPVFPMGIIDMITADGVFNNGLPFDVNLNWSVREGAGLDVWFYNISGAVLTTGLTLAAVCKIFGVWLSD